MSRSDEVGSLTSQAAFSALHSSISYCSGVAEGAGAARPPNLLKLEFKYDTTGQSDNNGSMREQKITVPTVGANPGFTATQTYVYDSLNRIQSAVENLTPIGGTSTQTWKQTFSIDRYGNRRFDAANTTTLGSCAASVCNPEINTSDNRLKKDRVDGSSVYYDFDANGALIKEVNAQRAAEALGSLGWKTSTDKLLDLLFDPSQEVVVSSVYALGQIEGLKAFQALESFVADSESRRFRKHETRPYDIYRRCRRIERSKNEIRRAFLILSFAFQMTVS